MERTMRFFITEEERKRIGSTSFVEFQRGKYDGACWHIDSLCMDEDIFYELKLRRFFSMLLPQFDYFGITQVSCEEFRKLKEASVNYSTDVAACVTELSEWLGPEVEDSVFFTICGM